jgi:hypothetical protein
MKTFYALLLLLWLKTKLTVRQSINLTGISPNYKKLCSLATLCPVLLLYIHYNHKIILFLLLFLQKRPENDVILWLFCL